MGKCRPCGSGTAPFSEKKARQRLCEISGWELAPDAKSIRAEYLMKDFGAAVRLINQIAEIAERENHHPDIHLTGYRALSIELSTHAIHGLSENDFILASEINALPKPTRKDC